MSLAVGQALGERAHLILAGVALRTGLALGKCSVVLRWLGMGHRLSSSGRRVMDVGLERRHCVTHLRVRGTWPGGRWNLGAAHFIRDSPHLCEQVGPPGYN